MLFSIETRRSAVYAPAVSRYDFKNVFDTLIPEVQACFYLKNKTSYGK